MLNNRGTLVEEEMLRNSKRSETKSSRIESWNSKRCMEMDEEIQTMERFTKKPSLSLSKKRWSAQIEIALSLSIKSDREKIIYF